MSYSSNAGKRKMRSLSSIQESLRSSPLITKKRGIFYISLDPEGGAPQCTEEREGSNIHTWKGRLTHASGEADESLLLLLISTEGEEASSYSFLNQTTFIIIMKRRRERLYLHFLLIIWRVYLLFVRPLRRGRRFETAFSLAFLGPLY